MSYGSIDRISIFFFNSGQCLIRFPGLPVERNPCFGHFYGTNFHYSNTFHSLILLSNLHLKQNKRKCNSFTGVS